jgi:6-phosphogluconolactonase
MLNGFAGENSCSELCLHPTSERFLFAANRGPDCITTFLRDPSTGALTGISAAQTGGAHPRNFAISPDGRWLVCANRFDHELRSFAVASLTGALVPTGHKTVLPEPCCVHFAR